MPDNEPAPRLRPVTGDFVDRLAGIFANEGRAEYLGESVSMAEHMLQTAALADQAGAPESLVAACLLHDIGHFAQIRTPGIDLASDWHRGHDEAGATFLEGRFGPEVCEPVRLHVAAKRYLCTVEPGYLERLSPASRHTFDVQGGGLSAEQRAAFETRPHAEQALSLRRWEEAGKTAGTQVSSFAHYASLLRALRGAPSNA